MHLSIVTPSLKACVDSDDFTEQYDGGNTEILQQFLAQTLRRMPEIYGLDFPSGVAGWRGVFVQRFDHVFCCWLAELYAS